MVSDDKVGCFKCPCCTFCKECAGFQKVAELKDIGLLIYRHVRSSSAAPDKRGSQKDGLPEKSGSEDSQARPDSRAEVDQPPKISEAAKEVFILQNTKDVEITSADFVPEFERNKVNCPRCEHIMSHAQALLQTIRVIHKNDVRGICDHCRMKQSTRGMCYICEKIVKKFTATKEKMDREKIMRKRLEAFLGKVHKLWEADLKKKGKPYTDDDMDQFDQLRGRRPYTDDDILDRRLPGRTPSTMMQPVPSTLMPPSHRKAKSEKQPTLTPSGRLRKYHSDDSLVKSFSDIHEDDYKKHLKYFFPQKTKKGKHAKDFAVGKSSTTLFKDTHSRLKGEAEKKKKHEDDLRKEKESKKTEKSAKSKGHGSLSDDESYEIDPKTGKKIKKKSALVDEYEIDPKTGKKIKKKSAGADEYEIDPKTGKKVKKKTAADEYEIDPKTGKKIKTRSAGITDEKGSQDREKLKKEDLLKAKGKGKEGQAGSDRDATESGKGKKGKDAHVQRFAKELDRQEKEQESHLKSRKMQEDKVRKAQEQATMRTKLGEEPKTFKDAQEKMKELHAKGSKLRQDRSSRGMAAGGESSRSRKDLALKDVKTVRADHDDLILKLVQVKKEGRMPKAEPLQALPCLPSKRIRRRKSRSSIGPSKSEIDLDNDSLLRKKVGGDMEEEEIIVHKEICLKTDVPIKPPEEVEPALFKFSLTIEPGVDTLIEPIQTGQEALSAKTAKPATEDVSPGIVRYALSDRTFIDKGWTMLPTEKVVRKMNVYRMRPARPEFDWFEHNRKKGLMQYKSGEKLAEFDDDGRGRWYYRNGRLALDYYDAEDINAQQRFLVYSSGEPDDRGRSRPVTVLGMFDYLGNGIIFDHGGKIRLKYNQSEGIVLDREIGPMSHWKWHSLNDPPVLQQVMIDTHMAYKDPDIINLGSPEDIKIRQENEEMLAIEFDNFIKEKNQKSSQKYRPFQIKMKAVKINEQFSLKILDQSSIYLLFRDGSTNLKLNLGMVLDHQEIVDTDNAELGEVPTDLDRLPAKTDSMAELQRNMAVAKHMVRAQTERERRLRPQPPVASVDRLVAAASRPLRHPLQVLPSTSEIVIGDPCPCKRKKNTNYLYYDIV